MNRPALATGLLFLLTGCGASFQERRSLPTKASSPSVVAPVPASSDALADVPRPVTPTKRGGYYQDDGPAAQVPDNLESIPDAEPKWEPLNRGTARPYVVFGKSYTPHTAIKPFKQRGIASWYGKKFHGQKTSSGERYDMFAMTAAHTLLPIPSYVRVTNPASGKSVVVRINDRGPFHADRIIDLSYTAAQKLGYIGRGSTAVEIEQIIPGESPGGTSYAQVAPPKKSIKSTEPVQADAPDELAGLIERLDGEPERPDAPGGSAKVNSVATTTTKSSGSKASEKINTNVKASEATPAIYIQLGAFSNADNAENFRAHLERDLDWIEEDIRVFSSALASGGAIHRVQLGPFTSRAVAEKLADRVHDAVGSRPTLVSR